MRSRCLLLLLCLGLSDASPAADKAFFAGAVDAVVHKDRAAAGGRVLVADMSKVRGTVFRFSTPRLTPGRYRLLVPLKLSEMNSLNTTALNWQLQVTGAGIGSRDVDILWIERPRIYQAIPCEFVVETAGPATVSLSWERRATDPSGASVKMRVKAGEAPALPAAGAGNDGLGGDDAGLDIQLEDEPDVATVAYLHLAVAPPEWELLADAWIAGLEVDKIRYRPGERARIAFTVRNGAAESRQLSLAVDYLQGLDAVIPVERRDLTLEAGEASSIVLTETPPFDAKWGYAVRVRLLAGERLVDARQEYFTVHDNMWAIMMAGRAPAQFTAHITAEKAAAAARRNQQRYRNWIESGFWAPDEFGDFTPDTETWWGGQGNYYGSISGTKAMIEEGHKRGISFAVYSNIWGGDGPPAFEMARQHPDWAYPSTFNTEWFERWDRNTIGTGAPGMGLHVWPYTIINHAIDEPFQHHGRELIGTHRMFGWDAVRYDSHAISDETARMVEVAREVVWAELPEFQWGYNSSVPHWVPAKEAAFKAQCKAGGLIMEEGIRGYGENQQSYDAFAQRILKFRAEARHYGGHFTAIGMDKCYANDLLYQYIFWFAANTHMCYDWPDVSVADYAQFATRFAGLIWDHAVTPVPDPAASIDLGDAADQLWRWTDYVHQRDLGDGRRQLIVHLINRPLETVLYTHDDAKLPPPRENLPLSIRLPGSPTVRGVWLLTAEPELTQQRLEHQLADGRLRVTVPRLRFWNILVVDLDHAEAFP